MRLEKAQDRLSIIDTVSRKVRGWTGRLGRRSSRAVTSLQISAAAAASVTVNVLRSVSI